MNVLLLLIIFSCQMAFANYNISSETVDGVTMTKNQEPDKNCVYLGSYQFKSQAMARDEKGIIAQAKAKKGNFVVESYDNYPSPTHYGKVFKCP